MSWLSSMFGGGHQQPQQTSPMGYLNDIPSQYTNPDMYNTIAGQYTHSPGYEMQMKNAMQAGNNAAAAGGMLGSGQHQFMNAETANGIASKDFQDYMRNRMGLGDVGASQKGMQATMMDRQRQQKNENHRAMMTAIMQAIGTALGSFGGPAGAAAGGAVGSYAGSGMAKQFWKDPG